MAQQNPLSTSNFYLPSTRKIALVIFLGLLAYMPLHILLSTWLGSSFGVLDFAKVAKDIVLVIGFGSVVVASCRKPWFKAFLTDRLTILIGLYAALHVLLMAVRPTDSDAELLGLVYNTRFLLFFVYAVLLARLYDADRLKRTSLKVVLGVASVVLLFGVLQYTLLPNDALTHVGYSRSNGVLPAFFIDDKPDLERAMSTLRDPNSFGSYIIIVSMLALAFFARTNNRSIKQITKGLLILSLLCVWFTFSRSAWLGFMLAAVVVALGQYKKRIKSEQLRSYALLAIAGLLIVTSFLYPLRNSYFVQNVVFHADETTTLENPNQLRARFVQESIGEIADNPIGYGPGTAGLASIRNDVQGVTLNENYYLQIAHEVGLLGLGLFMAILLIVALKLKRLASANTAALALLASFAGLAFTNLLVHIWSNEAVAYTWWGLAGLVLAGHQVKNKPQKTT